MLPTALRLPRPSLLAAALLLAAPLAAQAPPGYYDTVDTSSAQTLRDSLHAVIDDHQRFPYTSSATDTWDILELADEDPGNSSRIVTIYKNDSEAKQGGGNPFYNREHVWPRSYGIPDDTGSNYPFTDCHMLHLADPSYNTTRSNKPYGDCAPSHQELPSTPNNGIGGGSGVYPGNSNWTDGSFTNGRWEVWGPRKGDIARSLLYMDVRYEGGIHGGTGLTEADLILTDNVSLIDQSNTGSNESVAYMGLLSTLLSWHAQDPPDDFERNRNDVVFAFQGNRNPFVDHPEWVNVVWGVGPPPSQHTNIAFVNELHYENAGADVNELVEIAGPAGFDLTGFTLQAYDGATGNVYATVNLSGTLPDQQNGFGTASFAFPGLQDGPDAVAFVDTTNLVVDFVAYEGGVTGASGPATGLAATVLPVSESNGTPVGQSLQLAGTGTLREHFTWESPIAESPDLVNPNQVLQPICTTTATATFRNAGFLNPATLTTGPAVLGASWNVTVDAGFSGHDFAAVFAFMSATTAQLFTGQVLLTDPGSSPELLQQPFKAGPIASWTLTVPDLIGLCGYPSTVQAVCFGGTDPFVFTNAYDLILGE